MKKALIGKKVGMTQIFDEKGKVIPVTVIEAGPCVVAQVKTVESDGYNAVQLGFGDVKESKVNKPIKGHFAKSKLTLKKHLREFRIDDVASIKVGDELKADVFAKGDKVDIQGTSKGKGFQGVIKRHGQSRGPMGHGSMYHRRPGSMGDMVQCIIEDQVLWEQHQHQEEYLKVKNFQDVWETIQLQYKT